MTAFILGYPHRQLREVMTELVDLKVNKGKTETIDMSVEGAVFSEFPGTKVKIASVYIEQVCSSLVNSRFT